ncbi:hypothetical protein V8C42DRAFT_97800 [Trichoderma barbatum]
MRRERGMCTWLPRNRCPPSELPNESSCGALAETGSAEGSDGIRGSGAYLLNWEGRVQGQSAELLEEYRRAGMAKKIWKHTMNGCVRQIQQRGVADEASCCFCCIGSEHQDHRILICDQSREPPAVIDA